MPYYPRKPSRKLSKGKSLEVEYVSARDLPVLRRKRTLAFNRLTKTLEIAQLTERNECDLSKFMAHYSELSKIVNNFEEAHDDILSICENTEEQESEQDSIRSDFDDRYFEILAIYRRLTTTVEPCEESNKSFNQSPSVLKVKLPKIKLPQFNGNIKLWPEFYDIFNSLIHENGSLSDTERMHYLVSSLTGDALALMRTFPVTGSFYHDAYSALTARYKDKRELAFTCWKEILNVNLKVNSPRDLRRVLDTFNENLSILNRQGLPTDQWDFVICYLLLSKMDSKLRCAFERVTVAQEFPQYKDLKDFLHTKCEAMVRDTHFSTNNRENHTNEKPHKSGGLHKPSQGKRPTSAFLSNTVDKSPEVTYSSTSNVTSALSRPSQTALAPSTEPRKYKCPFCGDDHSISQCKSFTDKPVQERLEFVKTNHWCFNCLKASHGLKTCNSIFRCQVCRQRHHTLLHQDADMPKSDTQQKTTTAQVSVLTNTAGSSTVLLSTANIDIRDSSGNFQTFRALIDSGSQAHFITDCAAERLGLQRTQSTRKIQGLGQSSASATGTIRLSIGVNNENLFDVEALTLPKICGNMPVIKLNKSTWHHIRNLSLADPDCYLPGQIDVLLGAEVFPSLLLPGSVSGGSQQPSAINTVFGWILLGNVSCAGDQENPSSFFTSSDNLLHDQVRKFWEMENIPQASKLTPDEELCEQKYINEHSRDPSGRYIVSLPFKDKGKNLTFAGSRQHALRRFHSLERKLAANEALREQYCDFMNDYLQSGHMSLVPAKEINQGCYYIPHHCVLRPESATTKLRVVFDASAKDTRGISLNETLLVGPKLQTNIAEILLRFRTHFVVFTADIRQMYRQITIAFSDRDYQRIYWRFKPTDPIQEYRLNTVTYGVSAAPFLACRTIKQLVEDESDLPLAREVMTSDIYVDDVVSGSFDIQTAIQVKTEVIQLLKRGQFELRKWASNKPELLADLPPEHCLTDCVSMDVEKSNTLKVLGLKWCPSQDNFLFDVTPIDRHCTKRTILSELARIYDPLGFLTPLTFLAKCLVQKLWILGIDWDDSPPCEIVEQWRCYTNQLPLIKALKIPRCIAVKDMQSCQIHGFADSSESGYGAIIYLRVTSLDGSIAVFFLCAKSRVAPAKRVSLPRLELCAAVLLADLLKFVREVYSSLFSIAETFAWSDSTVVLSWIRSHSSRWKTFVANRVSRIHDSIPEARWNHVPTAENPADVASRGLLPAELVHNAIWWAGPPWLVQSSNSWPNSSLPVDEAGVSSEERVYTLLIHKESNFIDSLLERFSSIRKAQRILAYCTRLIERMRKKLSHNSDRHLTRAEIHNALMIFVRRVQSLEFGGEINRLKESQPLSKSMRKLNPFLDKSGILRVGGRLARSGLEFEHKHPALLPKDSKLTYMIIEAFHREHCHPGVNTMQYLVTQQFWILSPKRAIRHCLSKCLRCYRTNPSPLEPFMSDLPSLRINQAKPFSIVGIDYGGPFRIKLGRYRGAKISKAYLCLFVCFTTKAVHLETVSDLTADAFIAALRRFVGRRGRVSVIHSDCGTNFIGACNQLNRYMKEASDTANIAFKFNAPASSHFGGVWEIQIKSVKSHLYRIIGDQILTFEEMTTLFVQIESMLNSRPLYPLSSDPNDLNVLTPGHFLTLEPLTSVPDEDLSNINLGRLGRWQLIQRFQRDFWKRWKVEYLQSLTQRAKWTKHCKPLNVDSIVVIKNENTIPLHWPLARVVALHAGPDGVVRVATVRTADGSHFTRPLVKLCPLPNQTD